MQLVNKKIMVVGGSRGIGKAIALCMAREGAKIALTYANNGAQAMKVIDEIQELKGKAQAFRLDVENLSIFSEVLQKAITFLGGLDVLVHNAGIVYRTEFLKVSLEEYEKILRVNLRGAYFFSQQVARYMVEQKNGGSIIHVSSLSDRIANIGLTHYQCSKAALSMLSRGMALELAPYNIRVNAIVPGLVATDMNKEQREKFPEIWQSRVNTIPLGRAGSPQDVATSAILLASDGSQWMTGTTIVIDGGRAAV